MGASSQDERTKSNLSRSKSIKLKKDGHVQMVDTDDVDSVYEPFR